MTVTAFKDIFSNEPHYISLSEALKRIASGRSKAMVEAIRNSISKEQTEALKKKLPSILFSGKFKSRKDEDLIEHSGFVILDFDEVLAEAYKQELIQNEYIYACWISPSGSGVKALIKIADPKKHRQHLKAIFQDFPMADPVNINLARVCFESYDPEIYIHENSKVYTKIIERVTETQKETIRSGNEIFMRLQKWLINSGGAFREGERNIFIFKLASACCRFGIDEFDCVELISSEYLSKDSEFSKREAEQTIKSAYRANASSFKTASFENERAVTTETKKELDPKIFDTSIKPRDVIYGMDVVEDALHIYDNGYESAETTHIPMLDEIWKFKRGEVTLLSGIGNYGKSAFLSQILLIKSIKAKYKWAVFSPENFPAHEFYHDLTESLLGADCSGRSAAKPPRERYADAYKKVSEHFFFTYPMQESPTPELIRERFLELVVKEKVDGVLIDPFNQLSNQWGDRDDKYLEKFLSDTIRFARETNIFFFIINHPKQLRKDGQNNYPCPDVFDLANGAMWNNKADNILIYHRPNYQTDPKDPTCELHSKKIRRQKIVGRPATITFHYDIQTRRYLFNSESPLTEKQISIIDYSQPRKQDDFEF